MWRKVLNRSLWREHDSFVTVRRLTPKYPGVFLMQEYLARLQAAGASRD
jgi:hypothetical protein